MKMMVTVIEDTIVSGEGAVASPDFSIQECAADTNISGSNQQTSFCDRNGRSSSLEIISPTYTDVEGTFEKAVNGIQEVNDIDEGESSYFDLILTVYLPLTLLWFRRSMFGPANLVRSIVVG